MKILLLHDKGTATGGAELQILSLRDDLRQRGHDARLLASTATPVPGSEFLADYSCFGTNHEKLQVLTQTVNPSAYWTLRRVLHEFQPDVVHLRLFLWQLSPLVLPLLRDVPTLYQTSMYKAICPIGTKILPTGAACVERAGRVCLQHGCMTPQTWAVLMGQRALWQRWSGAIDQVVALSAEMRDKLVAEGVGPVEVIHNGVPERPARPPLSNPPVVAYAGRLVPEKGVDILLRAFAEAKTKVPTAQLLIAGQGSEEAFLKHLAATLGIAADITWLGHLPRAEMENHFDRAWVQVVPSFWAEPFGNVSTEAMMRGTAVLASDVGGQSDIVVDGKTGYLLAPGNEYALAERLIQLLRKPQQAEKLGQAGRARALSHFSEAKRTDQFLALYARLCALPQYGKV